MKRVQNYCRYRMSEEKKAQEAKKHQPFGKFAILRYQLMDIVWCPVYKGGTRTWREFFFEIDPRTVDEKSKIKKKSHGELIAMTLAITDVLNNVTYDKLAQQYNLNPLIQDDTENNHFHTFMVVRHPFERIVSAFRDKYEHSTKDWFKEPKKDYFYKRHGWKMVEQFRNEAIKKFGAEFFSKQNYYGSLYNVTGVQDDRFPRTKDHPIFWEFVQYILADNLHADEHWNPITAHCSICHVDYNNIIRFENLETEGDFVKKLFSRRRKRSNFTATTSASTANSQPSKALTKAFPSMISNERLTQIYFETFLDENDVERLYKAYEDDFRIFEYSFTFRNKRYPP